MDALLDAPRGQATDWGAVVALCDALNAADARDAAAAVQVLCVRLDAAQRARARARGLSGAAEERAVRALVLLDSLVKNVGAARAVAAARTTLALLERVADLKNRTASARAARERRKRRASPSSARREEATAILGSAAAGADAGGEDYEDEEGAGGEDAGGAAERAMRLIQTWGMLHPAEFPLYLRAVEKWKTAGVVFPPATPEDLLPLPPSCGTSSRGSANRRNSSGGNRASSSGSSISSTSSATEGKGSDDDENDGKSVLTPVVLRLCEVAGDTAALLMDVCAAAGAEEDDEEAAVDTAEVRATLVAQCRDMRTAMAAVVEAALVGRSLPPVAPGGPRVLVYRSGAREAARENAVAFLLGVVERLDTAVAAAEDAEKREKERAEERKKGVFNPFNLPESVVLPSAASSSPSASPTGTREGAPAPAAPAPAAPKKTSYLDELLGTAPPAQENTGAPKHDALEDLLSS